MILHFKTCGMLVILQSFVAILLIHFVWSKNIIWMQLYMLKYRVFNMG